MKVISVANGFVIYGRDKCIVVAASSAEEKEKWMSDLKRAIANCPDNKEDDRNFYPSLKSNSEFDIEMIMFENNFKYCGIAYFHKLGDNNLFSYLCLLLSQFLILSKVLLRHWTIRTKTAKVHWEATSRMSCSIGPTTQCTFVGTGAPASV